MFLQSILYQIIYIIVDSLSFKCSSTHHLTGTRLQTVNWASLLICWLRSWLQSEGGRSWRQAIAPLILGFVIRRWWSCMMLVARLCRMIHLIGFQFHRFCEATSYSYIQWKEDMLTNCLLLFFTYVYISC